MFKLVPLLVLQLLLSTGILAAHWHIDELLSTSDGEPISFESNSKLARQQRASVGLVGPKLNGSFVRLFDDLAQIHDNSLARLARLNYFRLDKRKLQAQTLPQRLLASPNLQQQQQQRPALLQPSWSTTTSNNTGASASEAMKPIQASKPARIRNSLVMLMHHFNRWLEQIGRKVREMLRHLRRTDVAGSGGKYSRTTIIEVSADQPLSDQDLPSLPRAKRELSQQQQQQEAEPFKPCSPMSESTRNRCDTSERLVSEHLNDSVPATSDTIERSCKNIDFLYTNCWPRPTGASLRESSVKTELEAQFDEQSQSSSCPYVTALAEALLDRVSWMWANLCLDKHFRLDYLSNLNCLRNWNQDKAQTACHSEYQLMQYNLNLPSKASVSQATLGSHEQARANARGPDTSRPTSEAAQQRTQRLAAAAEGGDGEILSSDPLSATREQESKVLCCMFDKFLRCVYKQALRDSCGPIGAQFVVNFMARIGTDDMKHICNSEPKKTSQLAASTPLPPARGRHSNQAPSSTSRRSSSYLGLLGLADKSPFIERNYCSEPRISTLLYRLQLIEGDKYLSPGGSQTRNPGRSKPKLDSNSGFAGTIAPDIYKNEFQLPPYSAGSSRFANFNNQLLSLVVLLSMVLSLLDIV